MEFDAAGSHRPLVSIIVSVSQGQIPNETNMAEGKLLCLQNENILAREKTQSTEKCQSLTNWDHKVKTESF